MAYQETHYTRQLKADSRAALLKAGHRILSKQGFAGISIAAVAAGASMATGNLYRYFSNKDALVVALFERASQHEIQAVFDSVNPSAPAALQMETLLTAFAQRACVNPVLSYALLAEPVGPALEQARQRYRSTWASHFQQVIQTGTDRGDFCQQPASTAAVAIVAAMADSLALRPDAQPLSDNHIAALVNFCLRGLGARP